MKRQQVIADLLALLVLSALQKASAEISDEFAIKAEETMELLKAIGKMMGDPEGPDDTDRLVISAAETAARASATAAEIEAKLGLAEAAVAWKAANAAYAKFNRLRTAAYY